jgi:hypothetical protein
MVTEGIETFARRIRSLQRAADRAQNKDFKLMWNNMIERLVFAEKARVNEQEKGDDTIH